MNRELFERVCLLRIEVEAHLTEPLEGFRVCNTRLHKVARHRPLVYELVDEVLQLASPQQRLLLQHRVSQYRQGGLDVICEFKRKAKIIRY